MVDQTRTFRERMMSSLVVPFAVGGSAVFMLIYFQMFHLEWFMNMFNDKAAGPFGLIMSALAGFVVGMLIGSRFLEYWTETFGKRSKP